MKKIKNFTLGILGATILSLGLFACSNDDATTANTVVKEQTEKVVSKSIFKYRKEMLNSLKTGQKIKTIISSSIPLDDNMSEIVIDKEIVSNKANVKIEYYIDDKFLLDINIEDGMIAYGGKGYPNNGICSTCDKDKDGNIKDSMDCSTKGVQQCAYATYQQWSTAKIVYMSLIGGSQAVLGDCTARNCFGW